MSTVHAVFFGVFILILVYLGVMNASGVNSIFTTTGTQSNTLIRTLQGR
jgi:hypothetical protein